MTYRADVELFQSFCRKYINKAIRAYFSDISEVNEDSLSVNSPRQATKKLLLHKDTDTLPLTLGRLLFWWLEAKGLMDEYIYGIPSTDFEIKYTYYPQVKLHFEESRYESSTNNRKPVRSELTFRWRSEDFSTDNIRDLARTVHIIFTNPVFSYGKGKQCWTYWDDKKGYRFTVYVQSETEAKSIIERIIAVQDEGIPDWTKHLREHNSQENFNIQETVRIMGETERKPKKRPVGTVKYQYAELFIHGNKKPIILSDITGYRPQAIRYG